ncbi:MAG: RNA-guided endonuclease InsQ/TnpB family protein [Xenococcaceae cyanobacterium]
MFSVKVQLKLNNKEKTLMAKHAGFARVIYNYGLSLFWDSLDVPAKNSKRLLTIKKCLTNYTKKKAEFSWMNELSSRVYQNAFIHLGKALKRWKEGIAKKPVFKSKKDGQSFTVDSSNGLILVPEGNLIKIPTLGVFKLAEPLKSGYITQTFTISKKAERWYVSFCIQAERIPPIVHEVYTKTGLDLGVSCFATLSDGSKIIAPKPYKQAKTKLGQQQNLARNKQLGNRKLGVKTSNNAKKFYQKLAKQHAKISNQRNDFLQKITTDLLKKYHILRIEDLNVKGMIANHKLSNAISDLGFSEFRRILSYKCAWYGGFLEIIDRWYPSSKQCRKCRTKHLGLKLQDRTFVCPTCHHVEDRDLHAAINLAIAPSDFVTSRIGSIRIDDRGLVPADRLG